MCWSGWLQVGRISRRRNPPFLPGAALSASLAEVSTRFAVACPIKRNDSYPCTTVKRRMRPILNARYKTVLKWIEVTVLDVTLHNPPRLGLVVPKRDVAIFRVRCATSAPRRAIPVLAMLLQTDF